MNSSLIGAIAVGIHLFLRVPESLHIDESLQFQFTSMSMFDAIKGSYIQSQPPLNNLIQHLFGLVFNPTNFTLRIPSILFAILSAGMLSRLLSVYLGTLHAIFLTCFVFLNPIMFTYSRYSRSYALCLFFIVALVYLTINYKEKTWYLVPIAASFLPWTRTVEGAVGITILWVFFLIVNHETIQLKRLFIWTSIVLCSLVTSLYFSLNTGSSYRSELDFRVVIISLLPRLKSVLQLGDGEFSYIDSFAWISTLIIIAFLANKGKKVILCAYLSYIIFSIASPILILSTSYIPLFPRYLYFYALVYSLNLYLMLYFITKKTPFVFTLLSFCSLFVFVTNSQEITRSPFPPFHQAAKYVAEYPNKNVYAFLPGDFNQYLAGWPAQPEKGKWVNWIPTFVKSGGNIPSAVLIFPFVDASFETTPTSLPGSSLIENGKSLGDRLMVIEFETNSYSKIKELSELDFHGAELWFKLMGLRVASQLGDLDEIENWLETVCVYSDKSINPGTVFGEWGNPGVSLSDFLSKNGFR